MKCIVYFKNWDSMFNHRLKNITFVFFWQFLITRMSTARYWAFTQIILCLLTKPSHFFLNIDHFKRSTEIIYDYACMARKKVPSTQKSWVEGGQIRAEQKKTLLLERLKLCDYIVFQVMYEFHTYYTGAFTATISAKLFTFRSRVHQGVNKTQNANQLNLHLFNNFSAYFWTIYFTVRITQSSTVPGIFELLAEGNISAEKNFLTP